jgi:3-phytase
MAAFVGFGSLIPLPTAADAPNGAAYTPSLPNGVASGDVTPTSAVLMARSSDPARLLFEWVEAPSEVAEESDFDDARRRSRWVRDPQVPAKLTLRALKPSTRYDYRVTNTRTGEYVTGAFRTPGRPGRFEGLIFGAGGDWQQAPPYPSLRNVEERDLDLFLKLGDSIYADSETPALPGVAQARTLEEFRIKHDEVASPRPEAPEFNVMPSLTRAQPLLVTIDDHELVDNFAGGALPGTSPDAPDLNPDEPPLFTDPVPYVNQTQAYRDALQAFGEYHPTKERRWFTPFDDRMHRRPKLFRYRRFADDAAIIVLDSRSFRDAQVEPVGNPSDPDAVAAFLTRIWEPGRTLLGQAQLAALQLNLLKAQLAGVTWKFVVIPEPIQNFGVVTAEDRFEGYAVERTTLLAFIDRAGIDNVVFIAGDFHGTLINNLTYQPEGPLGPVVPTNAFEIVTGPAAFFNGLFGPAVIGIALEAGLLSEDEKAFYDSLQVAPDMDSIPNDKDDFLKGLINAQTEPFGFDPMGLNENLPEAEGLIDATLLQGDYVAAHQFAWTEFNIDPDTQVLTVTIWATDAHSEAEFLADSDAVTALQPEIVTEFEVTPQ